MAEELLNNILEQQTANQENNYKQKLEEFRKRNYEMFDIEKIITNNKITIGLVKVSKEKIRKEIEDSGLFDRYVIPIYCKRIEIRDNLVLLKAEIFKKYNYEFDVNDVEKTIAALKNSDIIDTSEGYVYVAREPFTLIFYFPYNEIAMLVAPIYYEGY